MSTHWIHYLLHTTDNGPWGSFTSKTNCHAIIGFFVVKSFSASTTLLTTKKPVSKETGFASSGNWTPFDCAQDKLLAQSYI